MNYSEEQKKDITERVEKARKLLDELQLNPSAQIYYDNIGNDTFATKVIPYLQDLKYANNPKETKESVESE